MSIEVKIKKDLGSFKLDIAFACEGRRIGILGASGCGKSLTLKSIAGIEQPDAGRIAVNGRTLFDSKEKLSLKPQRRNVGYLFQNYALFPTMTVEQNIAAGITGNRAQVRRQVGRMIERFQLHGLEKRFPGQLSGGQQQRVALARILAYEPEMILLDEPFSALDAHLRDQMQQELMQMLKEYQGAVILVSHNRDEVYRMSEELLILDKGRIAAQGRTKQIFETPRNVASARLTGCKNIAPARIAADGRICVEDWKLEFVPEQALGKKTEQELGKETEQELGKETGRTPGKAVGAAAIRAHEFYIQKTGEKDELCFRVLDPMVTEDLFEYNISFLPSLESSKRLTWKVSKYIWQLKEQGVPDSIYLKKQDVLLLEDEA